MHSYEERLSTFKNWPAKFKPLYVKKLAILGLYSTDHNTLTTSCFYCHKRLEDWNVEDIPILEHMKHNNDCILFKMHYLKSRKSLIGFDDLVDKKEMDDLSKLNFVRFDLKKNKSFIFCGVCGSENKMHVCTKKKILKFKFLGNLHSASIDFYIKWLRGDFIEEIDKYINNEVFIPNKFHELVNRILEKGFCVSETINDVLQNNIEEIIKDFNDKMIEKEKSVFDKIFQ